MEMQVNAMKEQTIVTLEQQPCDMISLIGCMLRAGLIMIMPSTHTESKVPGGIGTSQPLNTSDGTYKGTYNVREGWGTDINADFLVGATKTFNKLTVDASFGGNTFRVVNHSFNQTVTNFIVRDFFSIANGTNQTQDYDYDRKPRLIHFMDWQNLDITQRFTSILRADKTGFRY